MYSNTISEPSARGIGRKKPVSALVTYELLVAPAVRRIQGEVATGLVEVPAVTEVALVNDSGREQFMRGVARTVHDAGGVVSWHVRPTGPQGSGILSSMSRANCLIRLPATTTSVPAGGAVTLSLPGVPSLW